MPVLRHQVPLDTAKSWAKRLAHSSKTLSPSAPWKLSQAQKAVAHILGFDDWHGLEVGLGEVTPDETGSNHYHQRVANPETISDWTLFWKDLLQQDGVDGIVLEHRIRGPLERGILVNLQFIHRKIEHLYLDSAKPHTLRAMEALWPEDIARLLVAGKKLDHFQGIVKIKNDEDLPHTYTSFYPEAEIYIRATRTPKNTSLHQMGLPGALVYALREIARRPKGLFVFSGDAGSGKEILMRACLGFTHDTHRAPREYIIPKVSPVPVMRQENLSEFTGHIQEPGHIDFRICAITTQESPIKADFARQINTKHGNEEEVTKAAKAAMQGKPDLLVLSDLRNSAGARAITQCLENGRAAWTSFNSSPHSTVERLEDFLPEAQWTQAGWLEGWAACRMIATLCPQCSVSAGKGSERLDGPGCGRCRGTGQTSRQMVVDLWQVVDGKAERRFCWLDQAKLLVASGVVSRGEANNSLGPLEGTCQEAD